MVMTIPSAIAALTALGPVGTSLIPILLSIVANPITPLVEEAKIIAAFNAALGPAAAAAALLAIGL